VVVALFYSFVTQLSAQNVSCSVANKVYVAPGQQGQARVLLNSWDRKSVVDRVGYALTIDGVTGQERILELKKPLTYDEAVDISLEEIKVMKAIDEPLWEELDRKREEYIRIHGEVELDEEEDD